MALSWSGPRYLHNGRRHEIQAATSSPFYSSPWAFKLGPRLLNISYQSSHFSVSFQAPSGSSRGVGDRGQAEDWY